MTIETTTNPMGNKLIFSPSETQKLLNISSSEFYREVERGNLTIFKVGRSTRVHRDVINGWLSSKMSQPVNSNVELMAS